MNSIKILGINRGFIQVVFVGMAILFSIGEVGNQANAADTSEIIQEMENSGALERAVGRVMEQLNDRQRRVQETEEKQEAERKAKMAENVRPIDAARDHILGAPDAVISIIIYSDFECLYCKRFHTTPQQVVRKIGPGVNLVFRHFPLDFHEPMASREAAGAICAARQGGNQQFWAFADAVMKQTEGSGKGIPAKDKKDPLLALAGALKLDAQKFQVCMKSEEVTKKIRDDIADGTNSGINGTPGIILRNNKTGKVFAMAGAVPDMVLELKIKEISLQSH